MEKVEKFNESVLNKFFLPTAGGIRGPQVDTAVGIVLKLLSQLCPICLIHPNSKWVNHVLKHLKTFGVKSWTK